mmetsp:Transcript_8918/g.20475  ORF Transcript_8918/g.20475 Transcript_8918/m.20475 type:complete len:205 (+) Transcript_8918:454-1068(+)
MEKGNVDRRQCQWDRDDDHRDRDHDHGELAYRGMSSDANAWYTSSLLRRWEGTYLPHGSLAGCGSAHPDSCTANPCKGCQGDTVQAGLSGSCAGLRVCATDGKSLLTTDSVDLFSSCRGRVCPEALICTVVISRCRFNFALSCPFCFDSCLRANRSGNLPLVPQPVGPLCILCLAAGFGGGGQLRGETAWCTGAAPWSTGTGFL